MVLHPNVDTGPKKMSIGQAPSFCLLPSHFTTYHLFLKVSVKGSYFI